MSSIPKPRRSRKILVASLGLATLKLGSAGLAACANLVAPPYEAPPPDAGHTPPDAAEFWWPDGSSDEADGGTPDADVDGGLDSGI